MIVIPMAGLSRRFREAGYAPPKYMLDLHGRSLFARTVESFKHLFTSEPFLFVVRDEAGTARFVAREAAELGVIRSRIVVLDAPTRGQAETVRLGLEGAAVADDEPLTIFNIDTLRPGFRPPDAPWAAHADGWLEVMRADDPGFSYARPDPAGGDRVAETAEKRVISDLASTGLYHFARADAFVRALEVEAASPSAAELYVAPLYNALIAEGGDVRYVEVASQDVLFCGVPAQYEALKARPDLFEGEA